MIILLCQCLYSSLSFCLLTSQSFHLYLLHHHHHQKVRLQDHIYLEKQKSCKKWINGVFFVPVSAAPSVYAYVISVDLNITDVAVINQLRTIVSHINYPVFISNQIQISDVIINTGGINIMGHNSVKMEPVQSMLPAAGNAQFYIF